MKPTAIVTADQTQAEACLPILMDSILGTYFDESLALTVLTEAAVRKELLVAVGETEVLGFCVLADRATFQVFPYLHLLAVKSEHRSRGIGTVLLRHLEQVTLGSPGYPFRPKIFLLVAEDNPGAIRFYERSGYTRKAVLEDVFSEGDTEFLYMKDLGPKPGFA